MKRVIVIFSLASVVIFNANAQEYCDTLKWKSLKSYYLGMDNNENFYRLGQLDGAVINIDTLSVFYLGSQVVNVSNDTFFANEGFGIAFSSIFYADTGVIAIGDWLSINYPFGMVYFPNDTMRSTSVEMEYDLSLIVNLLEQFGIELEEISYWQVIIGIFHTSKDGYYTDSVFYLGADTSIFRVVGSGVGIVGANSIRPTHIFPNPTNSHFTVTNTENASLQLYNMVGQEVFSTHSKEGNAVINIDFLPQGLYVLKVLKDGVLSTHKVIKD